MLLSGKLGIRIPFEVKEFARNQFTINFAGNCYFQSYGSMICMRDKEGIYYLDENYWNYSRITGKYRNKWLGEDINVTRKKIKNKEYILTNLNINE